jgi:hypothetical protein
MPAPTAPLRDLLPLVLPHAMGVPDFVATFNLRLSAIEFCERACAWRHLVTQTIEAEGETVLVAPDYATIHKIEHADLDGTRLTPVAYTDVGPNKLGEGASASWITQVNPTGVKILPQQAGELTVSVFLKPRHGSDFTASDDGMTDYFDVIPEFMAAQYGEVIAHGALARLFAMPAAEWFNPNLAAFYASGFERRAINEANASLKGQQRAPIRSKTVWF